MISKGVFLEMRRWARMALGSVSLIRFHVCGDWVDEVDCLGVGIGGVGGACGGMLNSWRRVRGGACEEQMAEQVVLQVGSQKRICNFL